MPRFRVLTTEASPTHFFGSEVRRAREAADMSQSELGDLVPCDKATVSVLRHVEVTIRAGMEPGSSGCTTPTPPGC